MRTTQTIRTMLIIQFIPSVLSRIQKGNRAGRLDMCIAEGGNIDFDAIAGFLFRKRNINRLPVITG